MSKRARNALTLVALLFCVVLIPGRPEALQGTTAEQPALTGRLLVAKEWMSDPRFAETVVY